MKEVHAPMTALENRFEDELASRVPNWHRPLEDFEKKQAKAKETKAPEKDEAITEKMILGT